jgi:hypothetical protein
LVENCRKIEIKYLLKGWQLEFKEGLLKSRLSAQGENIALCTTRTYYNGVRYWFKCPLCAKRAAILYQHPLDLKIGCRTCLKLDYRKRRYKGMIEEKSVPELS